MLRLRDVLPGPEFLHPGSRVKKEPDPRSGSAKKKFLTKKILLSSQKYDPWCLSLIPNPDLFHPGPRIWISDPRVKKALDPRSRTRNTVLNKQLYPTVAIRGLGTVPLYPGHSSFPVVPIIPVFLGKINITHRYLHINCAVPNSLQHAVYSLLLSQ